MKAEHSHLFDTSSYSTVNVVLDGLKRGSNFRKSEDVAVAREFIRITEDQISCFELKAAIQHIKICNAFNAFKQNNAPMCTMSSVETPTRLITKFCTCVPGCFSKVKFMRKKIGCTKKRKKRFARALFNGRKINRSREISDLRFVS